MTRTRKAVLGASIACLCVFALAGTTIGVTYARYSTSNSSEGNLFIPKWDFDLTEQEEASFNGNSSLLLRPNQSIYTDGNTNRYSVSDPIGLARVINIGEITGDVKASAGLNISNPYTPNDKFESNEQFENEFFSHFSVDLYYSYYLDSEYGDNFESTLTPVSEAEYITLYTDKEVEEDNTLNSSLYYYARVTWLSDLDGVNGDAFDTWVGRFIKEINLSFTFNAVQHGKSSGSTPEPTPTPEPTVSSARLGAFGSDGIHYYFNGLANGNYLDTTSIWDDAVDVTITDYGDDGVYLSFTNSENNLKYISYSTDTQVDISDKPFTWYWLEEEQVYASSIDTSEAHVLVLYETNHSIRAYKYSTANLNNPHIYPYTEEQENLEQETPELPDENTPKYKLGVYYGDNNYLYFNGTISSNHMQTTTSYENATDVYISGLNEGVDYTCTLSYFENNTLEYICCSGSGTNMKKDTEPYTWVWDDENNYFYTPSFDNRIIASQTTSQDYFAAYTAANAAYCVIPFDDDPAVVTPNSILISGHSNEVIEGSALELSVTVLPITANQTVTWSSTNETVASVDEDGTVHGLVASDTPVTIRATSVLDDTVYDEYEVTVTSLSTHEFIDEEYLSVTDNADGDYSGNTATGSLTGEQVKITIDQNKDGGGNSSSAPNWNSNGYVTIYYNQTITFEPFYEGYDIVKVVMNTTGNSYLGSEDATITDSSGNTAGVITREGISSSSGVVTLDVFRPGTITYTNVKDGSNTQIRVKDFTIYYGTPNDTAPDSIAISGSATELEIDDTLQLSATILPESANQYISWSSSDTHVATVSQDGLVTAIGGGEAIIYATSMVNDQVFGSYSITVNEEEYAPGEKVTKEAEISVTDLGTDFTRDDGSSYTFDSSNTDYIEDGKVMAYDDYSFTWFNGSASTGTRFWSGPQIRIYGGAYVIVSLTREDATLVSIVVHCASGGNASSLAVRANDDETYDGEGSTSGTTFTAIPYSGVNALTIERTGNSGNTQIESFTITYTYIA